MSDKEILEWCQYRIEQLRQEIINEHPDAIDKVLIEHRRGSVMAYEDVINYIKGE